ncbi:ribbon-helix-helix protein, CopG family, partial [Clostridium perfringens]
MDKNNKFTLNDEAYAKIQLIAKKEGRTEEEVVRRALSLYTT